MFRVLKEMTLSRAWSIFTVIFITGLTISGCLTRADTRLTSQRITPPNITLPARGATKSPITQAYSAMPAGDSPSITPRPTRTLRPTATASPTALGCWEEGGYIETGSLETEQLPMPLDYRIYLPPCYHEQTERRYPVLYLIHGQSYTDDQWDRLGADELADRLIGSGEISPIMIVMPRDRYGGQPSQNNFGRVVAEELVPYLDQNYRTLTGRNERAVGGLSRGGGWAIHLAMTRWDLFGALGGHSPAIFYDDAQRMRVYLDEIPADRMPRIYLDIGDNDRPEIMRAAFWFEELLNERSIPHEWYLFDGYHTEDYWREHLETYLRWYTQNW